MSVRITCLVLLVSRVAFANGGGGGIDGPCQYAPTFSQCLSSTWLAQCPSWQTPCNSMLDGALGTYAQSLPQRQALAPDGTHHAGSTVQTGAVTYDYVARKSVVHGVTGGYFGSVTNHQAYMLDPQLNGIVRTTPFGSSIHIDPQAGWNTDGTRVNSCQEYIYKRYTTYSQLQDAIAPLGHDWVAIENALFNGFYNANSYVELDDERGDLVGVARFPSHFANIYLSLPLASLPARQIAFDPSVTQVLGYLTTGGWYGGPAKSLDNLDLWWATYGQLREFGPDLLDERYLQQKEFRKALAERTRLWADWLDYSAARKCDTTQDPATWNACQWERNVMVQGAINEVDKRLNRMFLDGLATPDCFNGMWFGPVPVACGLSPHQLVDEFDDAVNKTREPDFDQCMRLTANAFGTGSIVAQARAGQLASIGIPALDYTADSGDFKTLLDRIDQMIGAVQLPVDPVTGKVMVGDKASDSGSFGNDLFGADYSYEAGWQLSDLGGAMCNANLHLKAAAHAGAHVFSNPVSILDFVASVDTAYTGPTSTDLHSVSSFWILDTQLYQPFDRHDPATFDLAVTNADNSFNVGAPFTATFTVGPIPVTVQAGLTAGVGYTSSVQGSLSRNCNDPVNPLAAKATGTLDPYAHLEAFASAGLGVPSIVEVGVRGTLTLVRLDLPFDVTMSIGLDSSGGLSLQGAGNLDVKLSTFGGKLAVFLDSLLYSAEATLIEWAGLSTDVNLFHFAFAYPFSIVNLKVGGGPESGQGL